MYIVMRYMTNLKGAATRPSKGTVSLRKLIQKSNGKQSIIMRIHIMHAQKLDYEIHITSRWPDLTKLAN